MAKHERARAFAAQPDPPAAKDFARLRASGQAAGVSRAIGGGFVAARNALAGRLVRLGVAPNHLTFFGFLMTVGAGYCLARGASQQVPYFVGAAGPTGWWPLAAAGFLILGGASDMLDGAVARLGRQNTAFGAIFDSVLDRCSDMAMFLGCAAHFAWHGNLTYQTLAVVALANAIIISYTKARAENLIPDCSPGYWTRPERVAAMLIGCLVGHVPAVLWQLAILSALTAWRRVWFTWRATAAQAAGRPLPPTGPGSGRWSRLLLWRYPRGSIPYDLVTGLNIAYIIFAARLWPQLLATGDAADPLGRWLGR